MTSPFGQLAAAGLLGPGTGKGQEKQQPPSPGASAQPLDSLEQALMKFGDDTYREFSRYRFAEEREWYEQALFYQRRQWLKWNDTSRRWTLVKQNPQQPKPMPVSNYFAQTVNANANQLNGNPVKVDATPNDEDDANQRSADFAEKAILAVDKETGFDILKPILGKHVVLWGLGVTKDIYDSGLSNGRVKVPQIEISTTRMLACPDCGGTYDVGPASESDSKGSAGYGGANSDDTGEKMPVAGDNHLSGVGQPERDAAKPQGQERAAAEGEEPACPQCGSRQGQIYEKKVPTVSQVTYFNKGKLSTEVRPIFEIYLPRDCQNANLAKRVLQRYRKPLSMLRRMYGKKAEDITVDQPIDIHEIYLEALRSLVNYNYLHEHAAETATVTELWSSWDELPKKLQEKLEAEYEEDSGQLEKFQEDGLYMVYAGGKMMDWGVNYMEGETPYTFFCWEVDPANVYPKGQAVDIVPVQKRLNRCDSLIELGMMCNAAGKWLWPKTQTTKPPSGSPNECIEYDPQGDGKVKPEFVQPEPFSAQVWQHRQQILMDFQRLGNTMGVAQGQMPAGGAKAFRALAYLGAKADEQMGTQRYLWELGHKLRYRKCLILAKRFWDEPRKAKVAGFNGRYSMQQFIGKDLEGDYSLDFEANSSRPRTEEEKTAAFASLLEAGMVNPQDSAVRDYVLNLANLDQVNLTDHLQYTKAQRDLDRLKRGMLPFENPFSKPDIFFKVFADFTLTEEFEALDAATQRNVLQYARLLQQKAAAAMAPPPQAMAQALGAALKKNPSQAPPNPLNGVPGESVSAGEAQQGAIQEGANVAGALP